MADQYEKTLFIRDNKHVRRHGGKDMLVTIVVPVYNVQEVLSRCLDSLINQTFQDIEIILVDDGSTDESRLICEAYEKRDSRIRFFHQENKGLGEARNSGISLARGTYVMFVDSDDWAASDMVEQMVRAAQEYPDADFVKCGFYYTKGKGMLAEEELWDENEKVAVAPALMHHFFDGIFWIVVWNALYKIDLVRKVKQPPLLAQDNYSSFFYLLFSKKCVIVNRPLYFYWVNPQGASKAPAKQILRRRHLLQNTEMILERIREENLSVEENILHRLHQKWARDWFHYIREDKNFRKWNRSISREVFRMLDFRRSIQLHCLLFIRHIRLTDET